MLPRSPWNAKIAVRSPEKSNTVYCEPVLDYQKKVHHQPASITIVPYSEVLIKDFYVPENDFFFSLVIIREPVSLHAPAPAPRAVQTQHSSAFVPVLKVARAPVNPALSKPQHPEPAARFRHCSAVFLYVRDYFLFQKCTI